MILWLVLLLALALPAPAAEEYARYDLKLSRLMYQQGAVSLEAGAVVEDWQAGRGGTRALPALKSLLARSQKLTAALEKLTPPASARTLHAAAVLVARGRTELIRLARDHVERGTGSPESQRDFMAKNLTANSELQARWLSERLTAARSAPVQSPRLREFYQWQTQMLPLTRTQVRVGSDIQRLVFLTADGAIKPLELQSQAGEATAVSLELRDKAGAVKPPAWLVTAHTRARAEQKALSELCGEIKRYTTERSEDQVAFVREAFKQLRQASQSAEEANLDALSTALNAR